jgi:serine protease Do
LSAALAGALTPLVAEAAALVETLQQSVVLVHDGGGHGSGIVWESNGLIVTSNHVVGHDHAQVELADGRSLLARVVARDAENDLALLIVPAARLPAARIGDARELRVGELVMAVGHPFGVRGSAAMGIVSGRGGATWMGRARREILQADLVLAPGNSGGPLANVAGAVVGIASMILSPGIAIAVPSHVVRRFVARTERCA